MGADQPVESALKPWALHLDARVEPDRLRARLSVGSLSRAFAETAGTFGGVPALTISGVTVSHGELDEAASRIGGWLASRGIRRGDRVMIAGPTAHELVRAYLGTLRCGATAMPVDAALTAPELERLLADAVPAAAFVAAEPAGLLAAVAEELRPELVIGLEPGAGAIALEAAESGPPIEPAGPGTAAILAYTSGTTGEPKGVPLSHGNVLSSIRAAMMAWRWGPGEVMVHALPLSHQHGLSGLHATLLAGSHAVIEPRFEPAGFLERIREFEASLVLAVPSIYERLIGSEPPGAGLESLRLAVSGSAPLPIAVAERIADWLGELPLERYGSTEAGLVLSNPYRGPRRAGRVGFPLPGVEVRLAGADGQPVENGEHGEILVRGPQVFGGYWRRPEATEEVLDADGWFRSGDIGQIDPADGSFAITGRSKEMIISGGLNVSPREVETVLDEYDGVRRSAVAGVPSERWGEEVVAFVVPATGALDQEGLIAHCRERLSAYKCPKRAIAIDELPTDEMGKVRRDRLAAIAGEGNGVRTEEEE